MTEAEPSQHMFLESGRSIRFRDRGAGQALVQLGGGALGLHQFDPLCPWLSESLRVVDCSVALSYDNARPYAAAAQDVWNLLDSLDIGAVALHGISTGAKIALEFASCYPEFVRRLVIGGFEGRPDRASLVMHAHWNLIAERLGMEALADEVLLRSFSREAFEIQGIAAQAQHWMRSSFCEVEAETYVRASRNSHSFDAERVCETVKAGTLLMAGRDDCIAPLVAGESGLGMLKLADLIPHSTLMIFNDMGHAYFYERASVVADAILQFVRTGRVPNYEGVSTLGGSHDTQ